MFNTHDMNADRGRPGPQRSLGRRRRGGPGHGHSHDHMGPGRRRGPGRRDGRRARGDVRAAVLVLLEEQPRNGYQIIQELTERSNEAWRPSPGSIYPILQQLEDEGLIEASATGSGRAYALSDAGRRFVEDEREQLGRPWENAGQGAEPARELMVAGREVVMAARQVVVVGSSSQLARATAILAEARRALYSLLAEGDAGPRDDS